MIDGWLIVAPVLLLALVGLVSAVGCEASGGPTFVMSLAFHYDPHLVVDGARIVVNRVDFTLEAINGVLYLDDGQTAQEGRLRVSADGTVTVSFVGVSGSSSKFGYADPAHGDYRAISGIRNNRDGQLRVRFACEAYRDASDTSPTYPAGSTPKELPVTSEIDLDFRLTQENARWVVTPV